MKRLTQKFLLPVLFCTLVFTACSDDDDTTVNPLETGTEVTIRNTFQSAYFSTYPGFEIFANETAFGDTLTAIIGNGLEFDNYLGLYSIDFSNTGINFQLAEEAPLGITFRTIEEGTFDRYYITFDKAQAFTSVSTDDEFVTASILSNTEIKVEISAGYSFTSGHSFNISVK